MTLVYLELKSHNDVVDLDGPMCDITCSTSIVLHVEPKYKFDLSLVTAKQFLHVIFVQL